MNRRDLIVLLAGGGIAIPAGAKAQQAGKMPAVGFFHPGFPDAVSPTIHNLRQGLRDEGYIEGENIRLDTRWGRGKPEAMLQLARELVRGGADIIVATARPSIEAARAASAELPIVAK